MITLSSDFGSPYPAAMKGVILQRCEARLVDVAHDFPRQDVRTSAFWLREVLPYFPPAVHLVVVDPGVGTDRRAIVVRAGDHALVGPDNGVLIPVARRLSGEGGSGETGEADGFDVFVIQTPGSDDGKSDEGKEDMADGSLDGGPDGRKEDGTDERQDWKTEQWPPTLESSTFHGRDVFAPAAARVHELGVDSLDDSAGFSRTNEFTDLSFSQPDVEDDAVVGAVLAVDGFGNVITNIPGDLLRDRFGTTVRVNGVDAPATKTYATADVGDRLVTVGSHGNVELAVNQGRGEDAFEVTTGESVRLSW